MPDSDVVRPAELAPLVDHSIRIGSDLRLVQGAGGNLSVKSDGVLWIKASGTRLAEAGRRSIFVPMDEVATRAAVLQTEDLADCVVADPATAGLRPSIEAALHVLLPHPVVFHVHGVGSIAAGLTEAAQQLATALPEPWDLVVVPYAKPGIELARAVLATLPAEPTAERPLVLLLVNHGLVVGGRDAAEVARVIDGVESALRRADVLPPSLSDGPPADEGQLCPPGTVDEAAAAVLCAGALTPDSAVFLGPAPFGRSAVPGPPPESGVHAAALPPDGSVWLRAGLGPDEREVAASLVDVARQTEPGTVSTLTADQVAELVNWEAEKWRRQLKR